MAINSSPMLKDVKECRSRSWQNCYGIQREEIVYTSHKVSYIVNSGILWGCKTMRSEQIKCVNKQKWPLTDPEQCKRTTWTSTVSSKGHHIMLTHHSLAHHKSEWNHWGWNSKEKSEHKSMKKEQKISVCITAVTVFFHLGFSFCKNELTMTLWLDGQDFFQ